jgi:hypothetical protein
MAFPHTFISMANFELAFTRVVRGQNKEYKNLFRHLYPSYQLGLRENLQDLINDIKAGRYSSSSGKKSSDANSHYQSNFRRHFGGETPDCRV